MDSRWQQFYQTTAEMVRLAHDCAWEQLSERQQQRDRQLQQLPPASNQEAGLLEELLKLNQLLERLGQQQREQLSNTVKQAQHQPYASTATHRHHVMPSHAPWKPAQHNTHATPQPSWREPACVASTGPTVIPSAL